MAQLVRAPSLDRGLAWLNTQVPLRFDHELTGRVVVLDFWTYCCINCMHILPDLAFLEAKYADQPVVFIGVHSAKFTNEAQRGTIRSAILRYEIKHPVVVDDRMAIWSSYGVRSWPTVVVVDPEGYVAGAVAGEGNRDALDRMIGELLETHRAKGTLAAEPLSLRHEAMVPAASGLAFPGKVAVDSIGRRLLIADSNHNRIVIATLPDESGRCELVQTIGAGQIGRDDGPPDRATFNHPQGLALHGESTLYVCDTENHLIRAVDLMTGEVKTVVGTGEMVYDRSGGKMGTQQGINSPWDVCVEGSTLYVAMAGEHQIWRIDMPVGFARALAGNGRENIVDGPTETAALAQPSGICVLEGTIYFADSEVSAIRGIDLAAERVFTLVGEGLFSFGDRDGTPPHAKLQHPLGVAPWRRTLLVADTYNHKIKQLDPRTRELRTLYGVGRPGTRAADDELMLDEPGGLAVAGDVAFVADTNNHRIVRIDLTTRVWSEVVVDGLVAPVVPGPAPEWIETPSHTLDPVSVPTDGALTLVLDAGLPDHMHLNAEAPCHVRVTDGARTLLARTVPADRLPLSLDFTLAGGLADAVWRVSLGLTCCTDADRGLCVPAELHWNVPVTPRADAPRRLPLSARLRLPEGIPDRAGHAQAR